MEADPRQPVRAFDRADGAMAAGVFLLLFAVYLTTLLPGLGGTEDTPKFQYIGAVLGTAHDPGYPLYTLLTHAWSRLPLGTLAYRINVFSAIWGAAACAFVLLALRSLHVRLWTAAPVACAMGFGGKFWQHSVFAEVYTLTAALTAATVLALLVWDATRRLRWLYAAVAAASLAFGAHLIFVGSLPAIVLFVLAALGWRLPWRIAVVSALIVLAGLAQYGYVWVRTVQHSAYLEARANTLSELADVMRGKQFESLSFRDTPQVVATRRVPAVLTEVGYEMGAAAAIFALGGAAHLVARRRRTAGLLLGAAAGQIALLAMLGDVAVGPIALPAIAVAWILAGCGIDGLRSLARTRTMERLAAATGAAIAVAITATLAAANVQANNHRGDTYDTDYMRLLFDDLPPKAAIVAEHYTLDHMVAYQKVVTGMGRVQTSVPPAPEWVDQLHDQGARIFAFDEGRRLLAHEFFMTPVELFGLTLDERLGLLDAGHIVIIAGTADPWPDLSSLGIRSGRAPRSRAVVIAVKGAGVVTQTPDGFDGQVGIAAGQQVGATGVVAPATIVASTAGGRAEIRVDDEPVITSNRGLVVVEVGSRVSAAYAALPARGMRVPVPMRRRPLFEVGDRIPADSCVDVGHGEWAPIGHATGNTLLAHLDNRNPATAELDVYLASGEPLPVALGEALGPGTPEISVEQFGQQRTQRERLATRMKEDGLPAAAALASAPFVARVHVRVDDRGASSTFQLLLGGIPSFVAGRGRVDAPAAARARLCSISPEPLRFSAETGRAEVYLGPGGDVYFGRGWGRTLPTVFGFEREVTAGDAELLLPLEAPAALDVAVRLGRTAGGGTAELIVNGSSLGSRPYPEGLNTVTWASPGAAWRTGVNRVVLRVQGAALPRVRRIELALADAGSGKQVTPGSGFGARRQSGKVASSQ
jgi:MFS family permease